MSITNIDGIPFIWEDHEDKQLFGNLFSNGLKPPDFRKSMPNINANKGSKIYKDASPFADYKWQNLKRNTDDVHKTFYPNASVNKLKNITIVQDPDSSFDLNEKDFTIYYERNNKEGYQSDEDYLLYHVKVFVSTDGKKIEQAVFECEQPNDNEACFFIEDNTNDWSEAKLYAKFGKNVKKNLLSGLSETDKLKTYLKTIPGINNEIIQELIEKGVVKQSGGIIKSMILYIGAVFAIPNAIAAGIGWFANVLGDAVLDHLSIPESVWNTDSDDYFLKKENLINSLTIGNDITTKVGNSLKPDSKAAELQNLSAQFIEHYTAKNNKTIATFISKYNAYVTNEINKLYQKLEEDNAEEDIRKSRIREMIAFLCGIWNGLVDFIGGILKFIGLILKTPYELTFDLEENLETFDNFCLAMSNVWDNIGDAFTEAFKKAKAYFKEQNGEDINNDKVAYAVGFGISFIATFFIPFAQITKIANFGKIGKALLPAKYLEEISISSEKAINFVTDKSKKAADAAGKIIDDIYALLSKGKQALSEFFEAIWKKIVDWFLKNKKALALVDDIEEALIAFIDILKKNRKYLESLKYVRSNRNLGKWIAIELESMVHLYTKSTYILLNKALRKLNGIVLTDEFIAMQKVLDDALEKLPISKYNDGILLRSAYFSEESIKKLFTVGKDFVDAGFFSTTHSEEALLRWMKNFPEQNVLFKVYGKNGKLIQAASDIPSECEVLFKSGTGFTVESVGKIKNPIQGREKIFEIILKEI